MTTTEEPTVGVVSLHTSKETKAILNAVTALGADAEWLRAENTTVDVTRRADERDTPDSEE